MARAELLVDLRAVLQTCTGLEFAVLFGSRARDTARLDSDVDVAILPANDWALGTELELQGKLARVARCQVDLVRLDTAGPLLQWEAIREGVLLIGDVSRFARYQAGIALEHADAAPALEAAARHYARQVAALGVRL